MVFRYLIVIPAVSLFIHFAACADVIHLKNGGTIEGIIIKDSKEQLVVDLGFATMSVGRAEIERIERSNRKDIGRLRRQWQSDYFDHSRFVPPRLREIADKLKDLEKLRSKAIQGNRRMDGLELKVEAIQEDLAKLKEEDLEASKRLKDASVNNNVGKYNQLVGKVNRLRSYINIKQNELIKVQNEFGTGNPAVSEYVQELSKFERYFRRKRKGFKKRRMKKEENAFLVQAHEKIKEFHGDFHNTEIHVPVTRGKHIILPVTVNGSVTGRFLLDTGASFVCFSEAFASRLHLDLSGIQPIEVVLADGKGIPAKPVVLKSVKVGNANRRNVQAVVTTNPPGPGLDGLLGMTFLGKFVINIDANSNKVILREFSAN